MIEAATVLPAICIIPALAIYTVGGVLGRLPIALDRINGARVFSTPEQIGRVLLFVFLVISAIRTFFWYFERPCRACRQINGFHPSELEAHVWIRMRRGRAVCMTCREDRAQRWRMR